MRLRHSTDRSHPRRTDRLGSRSTRMTALLAIAALAVAGLAGTASGTPSSVETADLVGVDKTGQQGPGPVVASHQVTLVTGQTVTLEEHAGGLQTATIAPDPDRPNQDAYSSLTTGDDLYVIPDSAQPYLVTDSLDRELFNVTKLVDYGYDDAERRAIPLIATYADGTPRLLGRSAPAGSVKTAELPSADAVALQTRKSKASTFWEAIDDDRAEAGRAQLARGIGKLWLDEPVHATLDQSVPQIGAPTAWAAGYDGAGVKVAVLDSGVDPTHPDLIGPVKEVRNFSTDADAVDHHGHGTHVASTIAGSGAASDGRYKGVAPKVDLYVGKVLDAQGNGSESDVISGMEWAAETIGADVISMSLGSPAPSDGTDPISQAVNQLTASTGSLFVIAAGNEGPGKSTIGSPGAADAALTVGNVTKQEELAPSSSRGPRSVDYAVKPEITAPGTNIVAARAAGTAMGTPVNDKYTSATGTSMATPHVAGAAAILAQEHPQWGPDRLKQVLVDTAASSYYMAYEEGAGRVDVAKAIDATVYSSPAVVSLGAHGAESPKASRTFDYVNPTDQDVTLSLRLEAFGEGDWPPEGTFSLNTTELVVPAGGSRPVTVTYDPTLGSIGDYRANIWVTASDGTDFHTTIGATKTVPTADLTLAAIDRHGADPTSEGEIYDLDSRNVIQIFTTDASKTIAVPIGRYSVMGYITTSDPVTGRVTDYTLGGDPEVDLDEPQSVLVDARKATQVEVTTPDAADSASLKLGYRQSVPELGGIAAMKVMGFTNRAYVIPTEPTDHSTFEFDYQQRFLSPTIRASYANGGGNLALRQVVYARSLFGPRTLRAVDVGLARPEDLAGRNLSGRLAVVTRDSEKFPEEQIAAAASAGAAAVILVNDRPGDYTAMVPRVDRTEIPAWTLTQGPGRDLLGRIAARTTNVNLKGIGNHPYAYNVALMVPDRIPADPTDTVTRANSSLVTADYRSADDSLIGDTLSAIRPLEVAVIQFIDYMDAPVARTEWYSTGSKWPTMDQMRWLHSVWPDPADPSTSVNDILRPYDAGTSSTETWLGAANGPAGPQGIVADRVDDDIIVSMAEMGDSQPGHYAWFTNPADSAQLRFYRDGDLLHETSCVGCPIGLPASPEPATYRIDIDAEHRPWFPLSTRTRTSWTFSSARPEAAHEPLALLWPRYGIDLDARNTMPGGNAGHFDLSFVTQAGDVADLDQLKVWTSADDGDRWRPAVVKPRSNGSYQVTAPNPADGYVSLRVSARDDRGSTVEQTLIRAYAIR